MRNRNMLEAAVGPKSFYAPGVQYTGTQYLVAQGSSTPRLSGGAAAGTISFWLRLDGNDGATHMLAKGANFIGNYMKFYRNTSNKIVFEFGNAGADYAWKTVNSYATSASWRHVMAAWNSSGSVQQIYVDGVSDSVSVSTTTPSNSGIKLDQFFTDSGPANLLVGAISQLWLDDSYLDISNSANRAKFNVGHVPQDLGRDGSTPTGASPLIYLNKDASFAGANAGRATHSGIKTNFDVTGAPLNTGTPT